MIPICDNCDEKNAWNPLLSCEAFKKSLVRKFGFKNFCDDWTPIKPKENIMKDKTLQIKQSRVLSAAEKCPDWKAGLKEMFPEAFKDKVRPIELIEGGGICEKSDDCIVWIDSDDETIRLDDEYDWVIAPETNTDCAELVPTRKPE